MKSIHWRWLLLWIVALSMLLVPMTSVLAQTEENSGSADGAAVDQIEHNEINLVYVIPIKQTIETGLEKFLIRAFAEAEDARADFVIIELSTLGGSVEAAANIGEMIRLSPIPNAVFVQGRAISAGSYISLNADQIFMDPGSSIGAAAVVTIGGEPVQDPKTLAYWIGEMRAAAESSGRNPDYAEGMVDASQEVYVQELDRTYGEGVLISFTAQDAVQAGYAEAITSHIREVLKEIGAEDATVVSVDLTLSEKIARFLTNPVVMTILLLVGLAGIGIELFVPGFGAPGIVGISAFVAYFFGQFVAGFAGIEHILLFVAGIVLLLIEVFVPSFGIFISLGIISLFAGIILAANNTENAVASLAIALIVAIVLIVVVSKIFQRKGIWSRFVLKDQFTTESGYVSSSSKQDLLGKTGVAVTPLRPSGTVMIDGERVDVVTDGEFIPSGHHIKVRKVEGSRVVVMESLDAEQIDQADESTSTGNSKSQATDLKSADDRRSNESDLNEER